VPQGKRTGVPPVSAHVKIALIAIPVVLVVAGGWTTYDRVYDNLAQQRQAIASEWAGVEEALDQRAALVQKLVERAKSFPVPPEKILREAGEARAAFTAGATAQDKMRANDRLSAALSHLLLYMDRYPELRRDTALEQLLDAIRISEDRIATSRLKYNETLQHYNARIQGFPHNLVARLSGFGRNDAYFKTIQF
jgi:LemA protein